MPFAGPMRSVCCLAVLFAGSGLTAEPSSLEAGVYEVEVKLELPHLEDTTQKKIVSICLTSEPAANTHGIRVLSDNNPLSKCPFVNSYEAGNQLSFDIICDGKNSAKASAHYVFAPQAFQGRITMQMGGKNMTMTEVQTGRRTGDCESSKQPAL